MNIYGTPPSSLRETPFLVQKGKLKGDGWNLDETGLVLDQVLIGTNSEGAGSPKSSEVRVTARLSANGVAQVHFKDRDQHDGMTASIGLDDKGMGLLTVFNEGPRGFVSETQVPLGPIDSGIVGPVETWQTDTFDSIRVCTGQGEYDAILLDDYTKIYLDGSFQKLPQSGRSS